ncbi:unnamed protein product [Cyclocybe aegerita]|uniref:Uncharacterized protein n=1 Tax=Cyclocybe aegerita TaxID=1973307 RepID=A0A8S0XYN0_CYCAE|nr:unnamed protein product [Cyclocybe aegerita]
MRNVPTELLADTISLMEDGLISLTMACVYPDNVYITERLSMAELREAEKIVYDSFEIIRQFSLFFPASPDVECCLEAVEIIEEYLPSLGLDMPLVEQADMQYNAASASSSSSTAAVLGATRRNRSPSIDVDGFKDPKLPLAGPSRQPITSYNFTKSPGSLSLTKSAELEVARVSESHRFPSPEESDNERDASGDEETRFSLRPTPQAHAPSRVARSEAPSSAPSTLLPINGDIERFYALELEQADEIRTLAKEVLSEAYKICLSMPGGLAGQYRTRIAGLLGEDVERQVVEDAKEMKETGKLHVRTPFRDMGNLGTRTTHPDANVGTPTRASMPPPSFSLSRKRLREEESIEDILEVENSLSLSRNPSIATISSSGGSPATKRLRLDSYRATFDENEDDTMLGLIWGRYFTTPEADVEDGEYSPKDEDKCDDESDSSSDMESQQEDFSIVALARGLPDDITGFIEETALYEADRLADEAATNRPPSPPPTNQFPIHSFGTAAERPPVPAPRPVPQVPRRLQRSNERIMINEDGSVEAFDYTTTDEYAARVAWERTSARSARSVGQSERALRPGRRPT